METAEIISFSERSNVPSVPREEYVGAIQLWCQTRNAADALSREEIGALQKFDRVDALRKGAILMLAQYYRKHERADVAPGVAVVIAMLSDNDQGASRISQQTLADLFGRSRTAISDAQSRLRNDGLIVTKGGRYASTYPVIPRAVTKSYNHMVWMIEAVCTQDANLNCQAGLDNCQLSGGSLQLDQMPVGPLQLESVNCQDEPVSIAKPDLHYFTKDNSLERKGETPNRVMGKVAAAVAVAMTAAPMPLAAQPHPIEHVQQDVAECWQTPKTRMMAGLNINELRAQRQVWMTANGLLEATGEFRAELEREYPAVSVKLGLTAAATNVNPEHGALTAMKTIRRQFAYMQTDAEGKQKRAEAYKKPDGWIL